MSSFALTLASLTRRVGAVDRLWMALAVSLALGLALAPEAARQSLGFIAESLLRVSPFLALAVAVAAGAGATGADNLIAHAFGGGGLKAVVVAALFGALSPFCSCGVVPVIAALLAMGVPLAPVMAFWLASPIMDPEIFFLTAGPLGLPFAVGKALAAIAIGLLGGTATWMLVRAGGISRPLRTDLAGAGNNCGSAGLADPAAVNWRFWRDAGRRRSFWRQTRSTTAFLVKWLTLAFALESLMLRYLPAESVTALLGGGSLLVVPLAALVGMPTYLNSYAAIPLMSGLIDLGMQPGAAMAFMTAGAVSSLPAAIAVFALVRPLVFLWYLGLAALGSVVVGYAYQFAVA